MTLDQIIQLTSNQKHGCELKVVEFKSSTSDLKGGCQSLCGFLNHEGGVVLKDFVEYVGRKRRTQSFLNKT